MLSREGEGQPVMGRASLDIFSPVREGQSCFFVGFPLLQDRNLTETSHFPSCVSDSHSGASSHRKTPLGTPLVASGRCFSPLSVFQTPPIKEEEPIPAAAAETCDHMKVLTSDLRL